MLSTLSRDNAVTTFDYRLVTIAWTGLSPDNSNAFTGALGASLVGALDKRGIPGSHKGCPYDLALENSVVPMHYY